MAEIRDYAGRYIGTVKHEDIFDISKHRNMDNKWDGEICQQVLKGFSNPNLNKYKMEEPEIYNNDHKPKKHMVDEHGNTIVGLLVDLKHLGYKGEIPKGYKISYRDNRGKIFTINLTHNPKRYVPTIDTSEHIAGIDYPKLNLYSFIIGFCAACLIIALLVNIFPICN